MKRTFDAKVLRELVIEGSDDMEIIENTLTGKSRWADIHTMVFKFEGKFYKSEYRQGATESQEEGPFEYVDSVDCIEVEPKEKTVIVYEPISD